ncbi:MAG TPA: UDP-N-acetylmuramate dehydrogenase [Gammaproteobacteria bacterium]|nr:UDP-N-acetylmuramate dehydrogenase [Gammaproteobacteria bacterium]
MTVLEHDIKLRGELLRDEPMSQHTSWRTGGTARTFYTPADRQDLLVFLQSLQADEKIVFLGLGSNLLVRDGGIDATVICLHGALTGLTIVEGDAGEGVVYAEAGVACAQLARFGAQHNLAGSEFFAGIPGTVGGALAMNAGAFGSETWQFVERVETIDRGGRVRSRQPDDYNVRYRSVEGPQHEWFLAAFFRLERDPGGGGKDRIKEMLNKRNVAQPIGVYSCGSVFRNPPGDYAGRLIEASGLKGYRIGGAEVSRKHANFIINDGKASAHDIEQLISYVQKQVESAHGVHLHPEVHIIGDPL